jgi:hypothetical protein
LAPFSSRHASTSTGHTLNGAETKAHTYEPKEQTHSLKRHKRIENKERVAKGNVETPELPTRADERIDQSKPITLA